MSEGRTIVHQVDVARRLPGGVDTCIQDLLAWSGTPIAVIGVDRTGERTLGRWETHGVHRFLPVARLVATERRRLPETVHLLFGVLRYRRQIPRRTLQAHRVEVGVMLSLLRRRATLVQFIHGSGEGGLTTASDSLWRWVPWAYRACERRACRRATDVVVFSKPGFSRLRSLNTEAVRYSPTWFDPRTFFCDGTTPTPGSVLWVGRLEKPKDPLLAIRSAASWRRSSLPWKLTMVGEGSMRPSVEALVRTEGLEDWVTITGPLSSHELARQMRAHEVVLATSHFEGVSRSILESQACGTPTVCTAGADPSGTVKAGATGFVVDDRSPEAIVHGISRARLLDRRRCASESDEYSASRVVAQVLAHPSRPLR